MQGIFQCKLLPVGDLALQAWSASLGRAWMKERRFGCCRTTFEDKKVFTRKKLQLAQNLRSAVVVVRSRVRRTRAIAIMLWRRGAGALRQTVVPALKVTEMVSAA